MYIFILVVHNTGVNKLYVWEICSSAFPPIIPRFAPSSTQLVTLPLYRGQSPEPEYKVTTLAITNSDMK